MYKILTSTASADSAMKLRDAIEENLGLKHKTILVSKDSGNCREDTVLLRYGCGYGNLAQEPEWSSKEFFHACIDKQIFSEHFKGIIPVPEFHQNAPKKFPVLIRETLTSSQSQGIHVVHNMDEFLEKWERGFFWTEYIPHEFELRVYVALSDKDYELRIYKKVPRTEADASNSEFVCGINGEDNTAWLLKSASYYPKVVSVVEKMLPYLHKLGGRFAGLDMIYSPDRKDYITLEMNSGPWLTKPAADWLARFFVAHQGQKFGLKGV